MCGFLNAGKTRREREDETPVSQPHASLSQREKKVYLLTHIIHEVWNSRTDAVASLILDPLLRPCEVQSVFCLKASNTL
jgi:hypothetical protein